MKTYALTLLAVIGTSLLAACNPLKSNPLENNLFAIYYQRIDYSEHEPVDHVDVFSYTPARDNPIVAKLQERGAVLLGRSAFSGNPSTREELVAFSQSIGANHVLWSTKYIETLHGTRSVPRRGPSTWVSTNNTTRYGQILWIEP